MIKTLAKKLILFYKYDQQKGKKKLEEIYNSVNVVI